MAAAWLYSHGCLLYSNLNRIKKNIQQREQEELCMAVGISPTQTDFPLTSCFADCALQLALPPIYCQIKALIEQMHHTAANVFDIMHAKVVEPMQDIALRI